MYAFAKVMGEGGRKIDAYCKAHGLTTSEFATQLMEAWADQNEVELPPAKPQGEGFDPIVKTYLRMRETKQALARECEEEVKAIEEQMAKLDGYLLQALNTQGVKSMAAVAGTFYKEEVIKPSCTDWPALYAWIVKEDAFEFLERRVTKSAVQAYMADNDALPPGISVLREWVVRVRRSKDS